MASRENRPNGAVFQLGREWEVATQSVVGGQQRRNPFAPDGVRADLFEVGAPLGSRHQVGRVQEDRFLGRRFGHGLIPQQMAGLNDQCEKRGQNLTGIVEKVKMLARFVKGPA
jgi:hypothetical protein